jgi:hypothetical protein
VTGKLDGRLYTTAQIASRFGVGEDVIETLIDEARRKLRSAGLNEGEV